MDKNKIKSHLQSFLAEAEQQPIGKTATEKVQKQEKGVNNDYYKEVTKKMGDYDRVSTDDADSIKSGDLEKSDSDEMDVNPNGMDQIQYDNNPSTKFKERAIEALEGSSKMGNKSYEGKWDPATGAGNGNTEEVWGASGGKHTGKEIVKSTKAVAKKDAKPQEDAVGYVPSPTKTKLATENKQINNEIIKESSKMKRLKFKQPFNGIGKALTLIPEGYKVDNKVFEMTDGNENYKIRWEGTLSEGQAIVLVASDKNMMNEDIQHMKHIMGFKSESTLGTPTSKERVSENTTFRDIMTLTSTILEGKEEGDKKPLRESAFAGHGFTSESNIDEVAPAVTENDVPENPEDYKKQPSYIGADKEGDDVTESKGEKPNDGGESTKIGSTADGIIRGAGHDKHIMEEDDMLEGFESPTVYSESDLSAGTDLGTKIGATASGDPRGDGHDKHIMEEDDTENEESILDEGWRDFLGMEKGDVVNSREQEFNATMDAAEAKGFKVQREFLLNKAKANKFRGKLVPVKGMLIYQDGASGLGKMAAGSSGSVAGQ